MGLVSEGRPLSWSQIKTQLSTLKQLALDDLVEIVNNKDQRKNEPFLFGDEIEFTLIRFDEKDKRVQLLLRSDEIVERFRRDNHRNESAVLPCTINRSEDCNFVIEGVPCRPFSFSINQIERIQENMSLRRQAVDKYLDDGESIVTLSLFPRFLNRNVNERRNKLVSIDLPVFRDERTPNPFIDSWWNDETGEHRVDSIHLDSSTSGWGCSCLQVTIQASSFDECLFVHDQLLVLTPIFLSLSVACPIWRGFLSEIDSRWNVLSQTTDDRTEQEIRENTFHSSRYGSSPIFLSESSSTYNDRILNFDQSVFDKLVDRGCPVQLAKHWSNLLYRDPLYVTEEQLDRQSTSTRYRFENHNSMVWNSLRLKPANGLSSSDDSQLGWRIEFRPMELQMNDFENAALVVFLVLLSRAILSFRLDLRLPVSLIEENMIRTQKRDQIDGEKFFFAEEFHLNSNSRKHRPMSINEIINGSDRQTGLVQWVEKYLDSLETIELKSRLTINRYLELIRQRARGQQMNNAKFIRHFVDNHPFYNRDSVVNERVQFDLLKLIEKSNQQ